MEHSLYVGLDVHKETIAVGLADSGRDKEVRFYGTIENNDTSIARLVRQLSKQGKQLSFCYEAGPCGYGIHRHLTGLGVDCAIIAPALIPRKAGDRVKTDRRDSLNLARLWRAGELTPIWIPDEEHEAMRELVRCRQEAKRDLKKARQRLLSLLLRHGIHYPGKTYWTKTHREWLAKLPSFKHRGLQQTFEEYKRAIDQHEARVKALDQTIEDLIPDWRFAPVVEALQALRGVSTIIAVSLIAEIGDISRFDNPRHLMAWLGLVPSEHSSGSTKVRGRLTKTGNALARTMLIEAGWSYRHKAKEGPRYLERVKNLPQDIRDVGWKAQDRLCRRYYRLLNKGKPPQKVVAAIARELAGFVWDITRKTPVNA